MFLLNCLEIFGVMYVFCDVLVMKSEQVQRRLEMGGILLKTIILNEGGKDNVIENVISVTDAREKLKFSSSTSSRCRSKIRRIYNPTL